MNTSGVKKFLAREWLYFLFLFVLPLVAVLLLDGFSEQWYKAGPLGGKAWSTSALLAFGPYAVTQLIRSLIWAGRVLKETP